MSLGSRLANLIAPNQPPQFAPTNDNTTAVFDDEEHNAGTAGLSKRSEFPSESSNMEKEEAEKMRRPSYINCMIAGGIGGTFGDMLMHSLDTVKTRQQGDPHVPPRYTSMASTYSTIFRQEGLRRGLYSGVTPALLGSFPGTLIFFGAYEYSKRQLLDLGVAPTLAYLAGGFLADFAASIVYVPSEVLKTRLQLQGRYNNPFFTSGYNYRSTLDALRTIVRTEGFHALFYGYKATIFRDLPFSALQFAFYEQERSWAMQWAGKPEIGLPLEILTGATAGGIAGVMTCPLDVVKTRIQTQINPNAAAASPVITPARSAASTASTTTTNTSSSPRATNLAKHSSPHGALAKGQPVRKTARHISTSSPSTSVRMPGSVNLDTSSVIMGLRLIYRTEGVAGWFRGVGPRAVWTSVQSGTMLVCYQQLLRQLEGPPTLLPEAADDGAAGILG